eukprot:3181226-Rhodomonas_salina.2
MKSQTELSVEKAKQLWDERYEFHSRSGCELVPVVVIYPKAWDSAQKGVVAYPDQRSSLPVHVLNMGVSWYV